MKYFLIFAFLTISNCLHKIELYRLNSYKINENIFGPKFSKFNLQLTHYKTKQLLRKATFLLFQDLQKPNLFTNMLAYKPGAIIIICPVYFNDDILQNKIWEQLFQQICIFLNFSKNKKKTFFSQIQTEDSKSLQIPIYMAWESKELMEYFNFAFSKVNKEK